MEKTLLIINPVAGKNKLKTTLYHVVEKICTEEENVTVKFTRKSLDAKEFAISAANDSFSKIICLGGDGTLNEVVSGVCKASRGINMTIAVGNVGFDIEDRRAVHEVSAGHV